MGTMDAVRSTERTEDGHRMLQEVFRVLRPGGRYVLISHSPPEKLGEQYLQDAVYRWAIEIAEVRNKKTDVVSHVYVCRKASDPSPPEVTAVEAAVLRGGG